MGRELDQEDDPVTLARRGGAVHRLSAEHLDLELSWSDEEGARAAHVVDSAVIGSAPSSAVRIADPTVSRIHAEIVWRGGAPWIRDLGSRNGSFVGGVQVECARVDDGALLRLGATDVHVRFASRKHEVPLWPGERFGPLWGGTLVMRALFGRLARISKTDSTVLILGETGTGKELVARAVHEASPRAKGPLVTVDCTAVPESLFESELFGHARGAFTGASAAHEGALEAAHGGTVFLDEIGELPASMQPKLLRAIESRTIRRVGETATRPIDVRFLAATHRDLPSMVNAGAFREDLYFRLAVLVAEVPPLRARLEDVPLLAAHLMPKGSEPLPQSALDALAERAWLGNVRELRNVVERAVALGIDEALSGPSPRARDTRGPSASLPSPELDRPFKHVRDEWMAHLEREYVRGWLERTGGNVTAVAEAIGLDRSYIHRLIKKHDLAR